MSATPAQADFRLLKSRVSLSMLLTHYGINLKQQGRELRGPCPFCAQESNQSKHRSRAFAVNPDKETFYCHACKKGGDIIKFVAEREGCTLKEAGLKIYDWFGHLFSEAAATSEPDEETTPKQPLGNLSPEPHPAAATTDLASLLEAILSELRQIRQRLEKGEC